MSIETRLLLVSSNTQFMAKRFAGDIHHLSFVSSTNPDELDAALASELPFDVIASDVVWDRSDFDIFDVVNAARRHNQMAPTLALTSGNSIEHDHLDEVAACPDIRVTVPLGDVAATLEAIETVARVPLAPSTVCPESSGRTLFDYFNSSSRGPTAARLAAEIASGRASDNNSLALAADVSPHTAAKLANVYLGPLIKERGEDGGLPINQAAVYRWCALHAPYIQSWYRRYGVPATCA